MIQNNSQRESQEEKEAFATWYSKRNARETYFKVDSALELYLQVDRSPTTQGWIQAAREGLQIASTHAARMAQITPSSWRDFESRERSGTIELASLRKLAEALDCELVYAIRPKKRITFSRVIWEKLFIEVRNHPFLKVCNQKARPSAIAALAKRTARCPQFRRKQNWSKRV